MILVVQRPIDDDSRGVAQVRVVEGIAYEKRVLGGQRVIQPDGEEVLVRGLVHVTPEDASVATDGAARPRVERQVGQNRRGYGHPSARQISLPGVRARNKEDVRGPFTAAQPFVVEEEEGAILDERSAEAAAELIALEREFLRVEKVAGVEGAITKEFKGSTVKLGAA